ncbi:uncharacterized protein LOC114519958 isoform X1 [Dendronephthya gigantea]|uniref:uncharacterized protein LOC114519958 isoform X1 n=1 Tax=Dendronephthya gigantea TaxID=151771 RepID=UPI00106A572F|nr:uncharacterized protein LOC114519958 isoform X1 [Dendronephthya gigantea]
MSSYSYLLKLPSDWLIKLVKRDLVVADSYHDDDVHKNTSRVYVMYQKLFFAFAVAVFIAKAGTALKCDDCSYTSKAPKYLQTCKNTRSADCSGSCFTSIWTDHNGTTTVYRGCNREDKTCPYAQALCDAEIENGDVKSCRAECCKTDNCNNYTPSSATGIMATKITVFVMMFSCFLFS